MKRFLTITTVFLLCLLLLLPVTGLCRELVAVGQIIGLELRDGSVTVAAIDEQWGQAARDAGIRVGDRIMKIDNRPIHTAQDVRDALAHSKGTVAVSLRRGKEEITCRLQPAITDQGPKLGLYLRQGISGVGTVTWYDPASGTFGALGHGVNQGSNQLLQITEGTAFRSWAAAASPTPWAFCRKTPHRVFSERPIRIFPAKKWKPLHGTRSKPARPPFCPQSPERKSGNILWKY